ncbi:MAG TPA: hypothetical protein ENH40_00120, partial [Nitrospirae bacterium]|nr:hypothetical protein [Nitrospirota bacterium]
RKEICKGCNTNIPPQLYNDIRSNKDDIFTCYYCSRFLFYSDASAQDGAKKADGERA